MNQLTRLTATLDRALDHAQTYEQKGRVLHVVGTLIRATVPAVRIGELCYLQNPFESNRLPAEVIGFAKQDVLLTPLGELAGLATDAQVIPTGRCHRVGVGPGLLGRVLDGLGRPLDEDQLGTLVTATSYPVYAVPPDPLRRRVIDRPLGLGVRAIDGLLTCGEGQRLGIFAAAGGGKSTLLGMMVRGAEVDVNVIALIGERGREVREFIERDLGPAGLAKSVVVVATSDKSSMERLRAAHVATTIAEYFRDQGKRVLLLMDSITRFARAQRELGLAAGEPPARRGFPPSVFTALPKLMERAGQSERGSITALYTVLVEGDDMTEPIADESRSILDGHIVLSRKLASANHFPAIDILASASRVMRSVVDSSHLQAAAAIRNHLAKFRDIELLVQIGEYRQGSDPEADRALAALPRIRTFLQQSIEQEPAFEDTLQQLQEVAR